MSFQLLFFSFQAFVLLSALLELLEDFCFWTFGLADLVVVAGSGVLLLCWWWHLLDLGADGLPEVVLGV